MSALTFIEDQIQESLMNLNTAMPCKVLSYNQGARTAKIQPLYMSKEVGQQPEPLSPIEDVPVLFQRFQVNGGTPQEYMPVLNAGDIVFVVFAQRALDNVLSGHIAYPEFHRHHSLRDAVITGVFP